MDKMEVMRNYTARFSARKQGAIGGFYGVTVRFRGPEGLNRTTGFDRAWGALNEAGYECHSLRSFRETEMVEQL